MGKVPERITHSQLYVYVTQYKILSSDQSGFGKGHSTGTCLMDFLDNIYMTIDIVTFETVDQYKYLGVLLDSNLTFKINTEYIANKVIK